MECLVVIPARGGSKGLPRKNLAELAGRPLVTHAIAAARGAARVTRVVVSTDDDAIAAVAERAGAEVVRRPAPLASDTASSESAVLHCLDTLREGDGYDPELVMLVQCTSPLTTSGDLDGAVATLLEAHADSCFTAVRFFHFLWERAEDGTARGVGHTGRQRRRRQELPPRYLENGAAYVARTARLREAGDRFCGKVVLHVVDAELCLEIDTPADLLHAEAILGGGSRHAAGAAPGEPLPGRIEGLPAQLEALPAQLEALPKRVEALVMDFDGVLTDDRVLVSQDGDEAVFCSRSDGLGLEQVRATTDIALWILSKERNPVVAQRAAKLGIPCLQGADDKASALRAWAAEHHLDLGAVVFVGNDVSDVACMRLCGGSACPADGHPEALRAARLVLTRPGGRGAVRELCELLLARHRETRKS